MSRSILRRLLPLLSLIPMGPAHCAYLHLCPAAAAPPGPVLASAAAADGSALRFVVTDRPAPAGCSSLALGGARVESLHAPGPQAHGAAAIVLQGEQQDGRFVVREQTLVLPERPGQPATPGAMPLRSNLLDAMRVTTYGSEERVQARLEAGRLHVACQAGVRPAGVLLGGPWPLPLLRGAMQLRFLGHGQFAWRAADAAQAARETALDMGTLSATGAESSLRLGLPPGLERAGWRQFVLACPAGPATLELRELALEPDPAAARQRPAPRSTWVWNHSDWREHGAALLDWAVEAGVSELFIAVPIAGDRVREPGALAAFVQAAGARGIAVSAVEGDPHLVLPAERAAGAARARALARYNRTAAPAARLASLQFDIEPYLLPPDVLAPSRLERDYLDTAAALRAAAGELPLDFVLPFWWAGKRELLGALARSADAVTVMDYRTAPDQIVAFAIPFLDWGAAHGKRVRIALEAGPLAPATERHYRVGPSGGAGDMLLLELGGHAVLALLREPLSIPGARPYRLAATRPIDGSATSFHGDHAALRALLPRLEADFGAWPGFAGIALHGLR